MTTYSSTQTLANHLEDARAARYTRDTHTASTTHYAHNTHYSTHPHFVSCDRELATPDCDICDDNGGWYNGGVWVVCTGDGVHECVAGKEYRS